MGHNTTCWKNQKGREIITAHFFIATVGRLRLCKGVMQQPDLNEFQAMTRAAKKIAVVDLGFLGDTVHLLPALWEIKDHCPKAELHVLTSPVGSEVLKMAACVDKVWAFPLGPPSPSWWKHLDILRSMRRERFDVSFNFSGADRTVFVSAFLNARHSMAYQGARKHFWQPWLIHHWIHRRTLPSPVYEGRRQILALCGFSLKPARFELSVPAQDRDWAEKTIPGGAVHLSLSASLPLKEWPLNNNLNLINYLLAKAAGRTMVVTAAANPREQARFEHVSREVKDSRLLLINDRLSVTRLAALLQRCALHVGPDSGVIHLAAALNIPTVGIYRRYHDMAGWLPQGPRHACFDAPCPCMESKNPACAATGEAACLAGISAEMIGQEICRRLTENTTAVPR